MTDGFLYVASGEKFVSEARTSAERVAAVMPEYPIAIVTDSDDAGDVFDTQIQFHEPPYSIEDKPKSLRKSPFERTVYLDTDTYMTEPVPELFDILDKFEFCAVHDVGRDYFAPDLDVPSIVPEYNSGVISYKQSDATEELLTQWETNSRHHRTEGIEGDQPGLRKAIYETDVNISAIPPEYNCRLGEPGVLCGQARILHGRRRPSWKAIDEKVNRTPEWRVHSPIGDDIGVYSPETASIYKYLLYSLSANGVLETMKIAKWYFLD